MAGSGLLFFELMFLTFRSMFTALFTFPDGAHPVPSTSLQVLICLDFVRRACW